MDERRKYPRISHKFKLDVHPVGGEGQGENVSQGGVAFQHPQNIAAGTVLALDLRVPGLEGIFHIKGKVVRCEPQGKSYMVAVNFVGVDADTEKSLSELVQTLA